MLGGFAQLSSPDISHSQACIDKLRSANELPSSNKGVALDCGAGIGRVTRLLLTHNFDRVDLVEPIDAFLSQAKLALSDPSDKLRGSGIVDQYYLAPLQEFSPQPSQYTVIWAQWVCGHLTDVDLQLFIQRCLNALESTNGLLMIKENVTRNESEDYGEIDTDDSSVTRSELRLKKIFTLAGARIVLQDTQTNFPDHMYPVIA